MYKLRIYTTKHRLLRFYEFRDRETLEFMRPTLTMPGTEAVSIGPDGFPLRE